MHALYLWMRMHTHTRTAFPRLALYLWVCAEQRGRTLLRLCLARLPRKLLCRQVQPMHVLVVVQEALNHLVDLCW